MVVIGGGSVECVECVGAKCVKCLNLGKHIFLLGSRWHHSCFSRKCAKECDNWVQSRPDSWKIQQAASTTAKDKNFVGEKQRRNFKLSGCDSKRVSGSGGGS